MGRHAELKQVKAALGIADRVPIVRGIGGVGKSTLAREYATRYRDDYQGGVLWLNAETVTTLAADVAGNAKTFGCTDLPTEPKALVQTVLAALPPGWLLVYDNVPGLFYEYGEGATKRQDPLEDYLPEPGRAHVLLTSRHGQWPKEFHPVPLDELPTKDLKSDGVRLLIQEAATDDQWAQIPDRIQGDDQRLDHLAHLVEVEGQAQDAIALATRLQGLPLGLVMAGALIREEGGSYREWMDRIGEVITAEVAGDYPRSLMAAVELSYRRLEPDARAVVDLFAWYAPEGLDAGLLTDVPGSWLWENFADYLEPISDHLRALCSDAARVNTALRELVTRSLLARDRESFEMHRLTAEAIRALQGDRRVEVSGAAAAVLAAAYPHESDYSENWPACARLTPHVLAYRRAVGTSAPALAAVDFLYNQASSYLQEIAGHGAALDLAEESLRQKSARLAEDHPEVALGHSVLGLAYMHAGQVANSVEPLRRAVELCEAHDHGAGPLAAGLNNLGTGLWNLYQQTGDRAVLQETRQVQERCLKIWEAEFGAESLEVASGLSNLASTLNLLGDRGAAIAAARRGLAIERDLLPAGDARLAFSLNNLGGYLLVDGAAAEAADLLREALDLRQQVLPEGHPHIAATADWLCSAYLKLGRRAEARDLADAFGLDWAQELRDAERFPDPR